MGVLSIVDRGLHDNWRLFQHDRRLVVEQRERGRPDRRSVHVLVNVLGNACHCKIHFG